MKSEQIVDFSSFKFVDQLQIPEHIHFYRATLRPSSGYKEQQLITAEILPRQEIFQQTVRCLLDKVRLEHAAPAPVISPLKTRPLTTPQRTSSRDVGSAASSWGGSRIGSGSLSKKDKQKLKRRRCTTRNSCSEENFAVSE